MYVWSDHFPSEGRVFTAIEKVPLVTQNRAERLHLYLWINGEEHYVAGKFDDQRVIHDDDLRNNRMSRESWWFGQIVQYYDRARLFFDQAQDDGLGAEDRRRLEMLAQQALVKGFMTAKGCVESSIRVFGPLPEPGHNSGEVHEWR